jgi:putative FmdB family regulatory protein
MPIYPYACDACEHYFEEFQKMADEPLKFCPACGLPGLKKIFCVPNVIVKGINSAKTIGQLAEQNTKALVEKHGAERAEEIIQEKIYGKGGKKLKLPKGASIIEKPEVIETPWWRSGDIPGTGPIDMTKIKDPVKYVKSGEKE